MVKWRMLNSDRVEVTPNDRQEAWQNLIINILQTSPNYNTYRTMVNKANLENFDFKIPIVYEVKNKTLLINNEFLNKALNRPRTMVSPLNVTSFQIVLVFICALLLIVIADITAHINDNDNRAVDLDDMEMQ
ncbi:pif-6 [Artaxa digramma nucleopolyhedrovirus]|uniref:Pif-6 n=1 Tax=Artaxa digramma nucleopolyhedrovirus TaxID=3070910 RepID=A0AAE6UZI0_9ABAC|nr:pif-6 [Euproctis digramma nucleopolyhedrovirus]QHB21726.1 pif-6 [Artaxa digramma nucleopolyhedrovirus]